MAMFLADQFVLAILVEGHLVIISFQLWLLASEKMLKVSYIGTYRKLATPPGGHVFDRSISFSLYL